MRDLTKIGTYVHLHFYFKFLYTSLMMVPQDRNMQLAYSTQKCIVVLDGDLPNYLLITSNVPNKRSK
jgi:hypothetical protein